MTRHYQNATQLVDALIEAVGNDIIVGIPIGIGKAIHVVDALFERATADPSVSLTIFTGLTLSPPHGRNDFESRLMGPLAERLYADCPTPLYAAAIASNDLPANIQIREFYMRPGAYLNNACAQQNYASINYSQVVDALVDLGVNVVAQLVAKSAEPPATYSLGSNPEITLDLLPLLEEQRKNGRAVAMVGQVNGNMPYMFGDAELSEDRFDFILDDAKYEFPLFGLVNRQVSIADYATAMHVASLIPDGGTLQLGIGSLSDAVAHCLCLRHDSPDVFREVLEQLPGAKRRRGSVPVELAPFEKGLYASSELLCDALLTLFERGLIKRPADDNDPTLIHAGFFVGSNALYRSLNQMPREQRSLISMTRISYVNTLFGDEQLKRRQRRQARFVNETMMATLLGSAISDTLMDGRVVSGVGGQFDFVSMAQSLQDAHSILMLRAKRGSGSAAQSNIKAAYPNATVPRHHRDIYVSEYGIAVTRGRTDMQVIDAMLQIADSSFQSELIDQAKNVHKLASDYQLPSDAANNSAQALQKVFEQPELRQHFPDYPLGTDLTPVEQELIVALAWLKSNIAGTTNKLQVSLQALLCRRSPHNDAALARMGLSQAKSLTERLQQRLLNYSLIRTSK